MPPFLSLISAAFFSCSCSTKSCGPSDFSFSSIFVVVNSFKVASLERRLAYAHLEFSSQWNFIQQFNHAGTGWLHDQVNSKCWLNVLYYQFQQTLLPRKKLGCRNFPLTAILVFDVDANEIGFAPFVMKNCVLQVKSFMIEKQKNSKLFTLKTKV